MSNHLRGDPAPPVPAARAPQASRAPRAPELAVTRCTRDGEVRVRVWPADDDASRRPVLFCCHAWTESSRSFAPLAEALGRRWTLVAVDAPGHGGTPWRPGPRYRVADHAGPAIAVLDGLPEVDGRRAPVVVLGHGLGALTAARVAAARPRTVRHLVLEEPARTAVRRTRSAAWTRARVAALQSLDRAGLVAAARAEEPDWPGEELEAWADGIAAVSVRALSVPVTWGEPLAALLAAVPVPVTLVHGRLARGGTVSGVGARRGAAACPGGCDVVPLEAGSSPRREAREEFTAVLAAVLARYEEPSTGG